MKMLKTISPLIALLILTAVHFERNVRDRVPVGVSAYHARVRDAIASVPYTVGPWVGVDREISANALRILDANVSLSRTYKNIETGQTATLLLVHSGDVRSLLGHYPPVCYHNQGWTQHSARPVTIAAGGIAVEATEYSFSYDSAGDHTMLAVLHFTALPNGKTSPDMSDLESAARESTSKFLGAASIQFVVDGALSEDEKESVYGVLLDAAKDWLSIVRFGFAAQPGR